MPFHVEVDSSPQRARVFNVEEAELWRTVLDPWLRGQTFEFGEQEFDPRESKLTILEGKTMEGPDLSFGQGWTNALRASEDVTRAVLNSAETRMPPPDAAVIEAESLDAGLEQVKAGLSPARIEWAEAKKRIDGRDPAVAAVILVLRPSEPGQR
jgi:uncharacterized protein YhaN